MAIRIMDSIKTANDSTEFPVAFGDSIWLNKDKTGATENYSDLQTMYNNSELGDGSSSIQVDTLPIPSEDEVGNIYQYIAKSGTYQNGYFYRCDSFSYLGWEDGSSNVVYTKDLENAVGKKVYTVRGGTYGEVGTITELADDNSTMTYDDSNGNTVDCTRNNSYDVSDAGYTWTEIVYGSNLQEGDGIDITNDTISVVDRLVVTDTMPTASASLLNATRLFVGTTTSDFSKGGIYQCQSDGEGDYKWVLISQADVDLSHYKKIFNGTMDEWDALTEAEQAKYDFIATPDEAVEDIADAIIDGDMRAITSNAVAQVVPSDASSSNQLATKSDLTKYSYLTSSQSWIGEWTEFNTEKYLSFYSFTTPYSGKYRLHSSLIYNINNTDAAVVNLRYLNYTSSQQLHTSQISSYGNSRYSINMDCIVELNAGDVVHLQFNTESTQTIRWIQRDANHGDYWQYLG